MGIYRKTTRPTRENETSLRRRERFSRLCPCYQFPQNTPVFHPNYLIYHATLMIWSSLAGPTYRFIRSRPFIPSRRRHSALMRRHLSRFIGFREKGSLGMWWCGATFFGGLLRHFVVVVVEKENPSAWISHVPCSLGTCLKRKFPFLRVGINNRSYII